MIAVLTTAIVVVTLGGTGSLPLGLPFTPAALTVPTGPTPARGSTDLASVADDGGPLIDSSLNPQISGDGNWAIFDTDSSACADCFGTDFPDPDPLDPDSAVYRVFVRNLDPAAPALHRTVQVSIGNSDLPDSGVSLDTIITPDGADPDSYAQQGSISADGRYVSFLTYAENIVPTTSNGSTLTLVVCDRDPDNDGVYDELVPAAAPGFTQTRDYRCRDVFAGSGSDTINDTYTPRLSPDGSHIAWTQNTDSPRDEVEVAEVSDEDGLLAGPIVPVTVAGVHPDDSNSNPVLTDFGAVVMQSTRADGVNTIVRASVNGGTARRVDYDSTRPTNPDGTHNFLGDRTYQCGSDSSVTCPVTIDDPSTDDFGFDILFHYGGEDLTPAGGRMVLVQNPFSATPKSEIVSRGNPTPANPAGPEVESDLGSISGDGRYVVFEVGVEGTHDGTANPAGNGDELVARDVVLDQERADAGLRRLPGALVTADANPDCTPAATDLYCESADGFPEFESISLSHDGAKVAFDTGLNDLIPTDASNTDNLYGDVNGEDDVYIRTWQPVLSTTPSNFGNVQVGTHATRQIPITVRGFGPVRLGALSIAGADPSQFQLGANTCEGELLNTGDKCVVAINATPTSVGAKTATVRIDSPQYATPERVATVSVNGVLSGTQGSRADNTRTSVRSDGHQSPDGGYDSMISGNGRYQVFVSRANLAGHTPIEPPVDQFDRSSNIFVRDLADPQRTVQISLHSTVAPSPARPSRPVATKGHPTGASGNDSSWDPSISSDGRFVSFFTRATDIVPFPPIPGGGPDFALVVCDRDPSNTTDAAGNPVLDLVRPGTRVPDYACYVVQSGAEFVYVDGNELNPDSTPQLSGDGTRIAWVEEAIGTAERVKVATLSTPGGALHAPTDVRYVPSTVGGFPSGTTRDDEEPTVQTDPTLTENGNAVVFRAQCAYPCAPRKAIIETTLSTGQSRRFDVALSGVGFLGDDSTADLGAPATSDDGNTVAFSFGGGDAPFSKVYVATRTGGKVSTRVESRTNAGIVSAGYEPALSGDGRYLAFQTSEPNESNAVDPLDGDCSGGDSGGGVNCQVVARDLVHDEAFFHGDAPWTPSEIVSSRRAEADGTVLCPDPLPAGRLCGANDTSSNPSIDETGSEIAFDSDASDIVVDDTNRICGEGCTKVGHATDTFVHTWRPTLTVQPGFDFGTHAVGTHKDRSFSMTLTGFGPISLAAATISGVNPADFAVLADNCAGKTLHDTDPPCTFKLRFQPSAAGTRTANLAYPIAKNSYPRHNPDSSIFYDPAFLAGLTGVGTGNGVLVPDPTTIDFGSRLPLAPGLTKPVTVTNTGAGTIIITDVTVQDTTHPGASGDYTVNATDCLGVLAPGASCVVEVTFVGHRTGRRDAQLVISDSVSPDPTLVGLLAKVPKPTILINPGVTPPGRVTLVFGKGFAPHRLVEVTLKGFGEHAKVRAKGNGTFEVGLVIFRSTPEGPQTVLAHTQGADKSIGAKNPLLIAVGSIDDLGLVTRH